ncbi:MAG: hypothetical protein HUJ69_02790 [Lachnospiraceae bacterium]|nr:hypothetical protein [Lachnospiraceae bacterium]
MKLQDKLIGALIGLSGAAESLPEMPDSTYDVIIRGLCATRTTDTADSEMMEKLIWEVITEKKKLVPDCFECQNPCGRTTDHDMSLVWTAAPEVRDLKSQLLEGLKELAAEAREEIISGETEAREETASGESEAREETAPGETEARRRKKQIICEVFSAIKYVDDVNYLRDITQRSKEK